MLIFALLFDYLMKAEVLETLISSKTRVKLLLKFFLNSRNTAYLRNLESEFGESTNGIRLELNKFEEAGMLKAHKDGKKKIFQANTKHPLFKEIHNILLKYVGLDRIVETVVERLGDVEQVYLIGEFAKGLDSNIIDLVFVGDINKQYLLKLIDKAEKAINRKIRFVIFGNDEFDGSQLSQFTAKPLLLWNNN